jgi:hypothetical protein
MAGDRYDHHTRSRPFGIRARYAPVPHEVAITSKYSDRTGKLSINGGRCPKTTTTLPPTTARKDPAGAREDPARAPAVPDVTGLTSRA